MAETASTPAPIIDRARKKALQAYGPRASELFDAALALVEGGAVQLLGRNVGRVTVGGLAFRVDLEDCPHCAIAGNPRLVCAHKLAVALATLLARAIGRQAGSPGQARPASAASLKPSPTGSAPSRMTGGSRQPRVRKSRRTSKGARANQCGNPHCRGWLDSSGHCNKCGWGTPLSRLH